MTVNYTKSNFEMKYQTKKAFSEIVHKNVETETNQPCGENPPFLLSLLGTRPIVCKSHFEIS